jgi:hypothetical protein
VAALTREQILARKTGRGTVTFADGGQVHIRALTRNEALAVRELDTVAEQDNLIISTGLVDPEMSVEDVAAWAASDAAGDLAAVSEGIAVISGMTPKSGKEATKSPAQ